VVLDRYVLSVLAHHLACGVSPMHVPPMNSLPILQPDLTFHIVTQEEVRLKRVMARGGANAQDLERADGDTLAARKLSFFKRMIPNTIDNSQESPLWAILQMLPFLR
jgi:thymidylate kinase